MTTIKQGMAFPNAQKIPALKFKLVNNFQSSGLSRDAESSSLGALVSLVKKDVKCKGEFMNMWSVHEIDGTLPIKNMPLPEVIDAFNYCIENNLQEPYRLADIVNLER